MFRPYQKAAKFLGESGCYFLSIVFLAEEILKKPLNPIALYFEFLEKKYITEDCFVSSPEKIFSELVHKRYMVAKETVEYKVKENEYEILRFEYKPSTMSLMAHFVVGNGLGEVEYDPYGDSQTVKNGRLISKRIFYPH